MPPEGLPAAGNSYTFRYRRALDGGGGGVSGSQKPWNKYLARCPRSGTAAGPLLLFSHSTLGYRQESNPTPAPSPRTVPNKASNLCHGVCLPCKSDKQGPNKEFQLQPLRCPGYLSPTATMLKKEHCCLPVQGGLEPLPPLPQPLQSQRTGKRSLLPHQIKMEKEEGGWGGVSKNPTMPHSPTVS